MNRSGDDSNVGNGNSADICGDGRISGTDTGITACGNGGIAGSSGVSSSTSCVTLVILNGYFAYIVC